MVVTIFRNRLKPEGIDEYYQWAARISALAKTMPGHISHKTYTAEDGERLTLVEFDTPENQANWSANLQHVEAKKKGRADFYTEYKLQVCSVVREMSFTAKVSAAAE
jgi:heme-degrading monooxygenase HmoA